MNKLAERRGCGRSSVTTLVMDALFASPTRFQKLWRVIGVMAVVALMAVGFWSLRPAPSITSSELDVLAFIDRVQTSDDVDEGYARLLPNGRYQIIERRQASKIQHVYLIASQREPDNVFRVVLDREGSYWRIVEVSAAA